MTTAELPAACQHAEAHVLLYMIHRDIPEVDVSSADISYDSLGNAAYICEMHLSFSPEDCCSIQPRVKVGEQALKNTELRLISELMKNSRRSDRELSRVLGISQPTVSRTIRKLEKEGVIKEYTMIPDFAKLGYELMVITLGTYKQPVKPEQMEEAQKVARKEAENPSLALLMMERGLGLGSEAAAIVLYKNYSEYDQVMQSARRYSFLDIEHLQSFLINLNDKVRYRPLTLSMLANHLRARLFEKKGGSA